MKITTIPFLSTSILFLALLLGGSPLKNKEINAAHDIDAVTVYLDNAEIIRKSKVNIPAGKSDILFDGISSAILGQGVKISTSNGVKVYAVAVENNPDIREQDPALLTLEQEEKGLIQEKNLLDVELSVIHREIDFFNKNMDMGGDARPNFGTLDAGAEYFREKHRKLQVRLHAVKDSMATLQEHLHDLDREMTEAKAKADKRGKRVRVTVINAAATDCELELRYLVSNAVWQPYYSIRAEGEGLPVTLEYQARVYNDTGNDWDNKPLTLAIMNPAEDLSKPRLDAWVLDEGGYHRQDEGRLSNAKGLYGKREDRAAAGGQFNVLQVEDLSTRFEIKDLHLIPADATPHTIDVTSYTCDADYYTLSIPKVKEGAYLVAGIRGWKQLGLLDGPANLYYKGVYQGVSTLDTRQISDTLDVSLGKESAYSVIRRKESSMSSEKLIGFNVREVLTYEILVENRKGGVADIELRDQIPVSTDKDVEVKALNLSGAELHALSGQLTWKLRLQPGETKRIVLSFMVKYPKSKRGILRHKSNKIYTPRYF